MRDRTFLTEAALALCIGAACVVSGGCALGEGAAVSISEHIGHEWRAQLLHWPVPDAARQWALVDERGRPVACQRYDQAPLVKTPLNGAGLYALVDLPAGASVNWRMQPGAPTGAPRVRVRREAEGIVLAGDRIEVRLAAETSRPDPAAVPGPVQALRLPGGKWFGKGRFAEAGKVQAIRGKVLAEGPLFAEAEVQYVWDKADRFRPWTEAKRYTCRVRVVAGQPVAHVTESFNLGDRPAIELALTGLPTPDKWNGQYVKAGDHTVEIHTMDVPQAAGRVARIPFWTFYSDRRTRYSAWFAGWSSKGDVPVVGIFPAFPQVRRKRDINEKKRTAWMRLEPLTVARDASGTIVFRHAVRYDGTAAYGLYVATKKDYLSQKPSGIAAAKRNYGETPLQRVKDWVLDWPDKTTYPRLFITPKVRARLKARMLATPALAKLASTRPAKINFLEDLTCYYLASGDEKAVKDLLYRGGRITNPRVIQQGPGLLRQLRMRVRHMFEGPGLAQPGINNMMWIADHLLYRLITADAVLGSPAVSDDERREIRRLFAILAYQMARPEMVPDYGSGYQIGMPNFIAPYYGTLGLIGGLLSNHPHAKRWVDRCEKELLRNVRNQVKPDGAWFESYYYQERTMRGLVPAAVGLARAGLDRMLTDPAVLAAFRGQIAQLTPVDPRVQKRCYPPIGDGTYYTPKLNLFWAAGALAKTHPELAGQMIWAWKQHGKPTAWIFNARDPFSLILGDPTVPERPVSFGSHVFTGAAAILRSRYNTPTESYLHLRAANFALSHFQGDQLSLHWYAKGAPLCLDWGYYGIRRHRPAGMHNRTVVAGLRDTSTKILKTVFAARADYVHTADHARTRVRRLLYVRGDRPDEPEYVFMRDSVSGKATWNLWTAASGIRMKLKDIDLGKEPATPADFEALRAKVLAAESSRFDKSLAELRLPFLLKPHGATLPAFAVPVLERQVDYRGPFGVDLTVHWLTDVDTVEMGADQWGIGYGGPKNWFKVGRGEHQKLLRLHRKTAGDFLTVLYPRLRGKEPDATVEPWGPNGVKISRADGIAQRAWISAPKWWQDKSATPMVAFIRDQVRARAEALLLCDWPDGRKELLLFEGTRLSSGRLDIKSDKVGSVGLRVRTGSAAGFSRGPARRLSLSLAQGEGAATVTVGGKAVPVRRDDGAVVFDVPEGACSFQVRWR